MKLAVAVSTLLALPVVAHADTWQIDSAHTTAGFEVTHMLLSTVRGQFEKTTGIVEIDDRDVTKSRIEVEIDAATVNTRNPDRDKHLRTADFFDVETHPKITFKSTKVEKAGKDRLKVTGDLTIRGTTKPVVLDVTYTGKQVKNPWGTMVRGASAVGSLNRKDFGVSWNKTLDGGGLIVSDEVKLVIDAELNPASKKQASN